MKCPNCQTENPDLAKFCKGCGSKLEAPASEAAIFCKGCGEALKPGAKFCPKCGTGVAAPTNAPVPPVSAPVPPSVPTPPAKPVYEGPNATVPPTAPVPPKAPAPPVAPVPPVSAPVPPSAPTPPPAKPVYEGPNATVPPTAPIPPKAPAPQPATPVPPKAPAPQPAAPVPPKAPAPQPASAPQPTASAPAKEKKGVPTALIIVCAVIVILAVVIVVLFKMGIFDAGTPAALDDSEKIYYDINATESTDTAEDGEATEEVATEDTSLSAEELAKIMTPIDVLKDEGLALLSEEDTVGSREKLSTALNQYLSIVQSDGTYDELTNRINDAYAGYVEATIIQINRLYAQDVSAGIYEQIVSDATVALDLSAKIADAGLEVDSSSIEEIMADLPANYKERYILAINELTEAESWSRSTAWAIMEDVSGLGLYDESDLDDPLRLRYAYSLAMYTRKANAADIESGNLSPRDAGMKILDSIEEMDYNPVLILDAADYFKQAGENYTSNTLYALYDDLTAIIEYYQGLRLPNDIPWDRFWYFNDFGEFSVDDRNGASPECRQEIRACAEAALSSL